MEDRKTDAKMNALILHGKPNKSSYFDTSYPSTSNSIWIPWLQHQLLLKDIPTQTPEMFNAWQPDYKIWKEEFERHRIDRNTLLIGHSCGAGFILQWLSENPSVKVNHVFLVAPSLGDRFTPNDPYEAPLLNGFFDFELSDTLIDSAQSITVLYSDNDNTRVNATIDYLKKMTTCCSYRLYKGFGHFKGIKDMPHNEAGTFPELLELIEERINSQ